MTLKLCRSVHTGRPPPLPMSSDVVDLHGLRENMEKAIAALKWEFTHSVVSRITPSVLDLVRVEYNNKQLPLKDLGQVSMPNAQTVIVNMSSQPQVSGFCYLWINRIHCRILFSCSL